MLNIVDNNTVFEFFRNLINIVILFTACLNIEITVTNVMSKHKRVGRNRLLLGKEKYIFAFSYQH